VQSVLTCHQLDSQSLFKYRKYALAISAGALFFAGFAWIYKLEKTQEKKKDLHFSRMSATRNRGKLNRVVDIAVFLAIFQLAARKIERKFSKISAHDFVGKPKK